MCAAAKRAKGEERMQATYVGTAAADFVRREAERHVRTAQKVTHKPRPNRQHV
jgi:hypothetical protein